MPGRVTSWHRHTVHLVGSTLEVEDTDDVGLIVTCPRFTTTRGPRRATWPLPSSRPAMPWRLHLPRPPENLPDGPPTLRRAGWLVVSGARVNLRLTGSVTCCPPVCVASAALGRRPRRSPRGRALRHGLTLPRHPGGPRLAMRIASQLPYGWCRPLTRRCSAPSTRATAPQPWQRPRGATAARRPVWSARQHQSRGNPPAPPPAHTRGARWPPDHRWPQRWLVVMQHVARE